MTSTLYEYKKCSTCRDARKWLDEHDIEYERVSLIDDTPSRDEIERLWKKSGYVLKRFFNVRGGAYRKAELREKYDGYSDEKRLTMLSEDGLLMKRPILETEDHVLVGFKESEYEEALG